MGVLHAQVDRYAVVINEIMVDPTPMVGLPNAEYIELRNCSKQTIDLQKWKIEKGTSSYLIGTATLLKPDSIIVLCSKSNTGFFSSIRSVAMNSFPALINEKAHLHSNHPTTLPFTLLIINLLGMKILSKQVEDGAWK